MNKAWYPEEFEQLWRAYGAPASASKKKGYDAYKKAKDIPNHPLLMQCVAAYNEYLKANSRPNNPHPKCHPATWLNQARYEGFLDRAEELLRLQTAVSDRRDASVSASGQTWPDAVLKALRLSEPILKTWVLPAVFVEENPYKIICPSRFHMNWLHEKFGMEIRRALGDNVVITYAR